MDKVVVCKSRPKFYWLCFNHEKHPHISTCWNAPPIHNRCSNLQFLHFYFIVFTFNCFFFFIFCLYFCPASPLAEAEVSSLSTRRRSSATNNCLVSSTTTLNGCKTFSMVARPSDSFHLFYSHTSDCVSMISFGHSSQSP